MGEQKVIRSVEGDEEADPEEYPFGRPSSRRPPRLFREGGYAPAGARVVEVSTHLGTYGMGGMGFFGLRVEGGAPAGTRWLVVTLWGAESWATLDGCVIEDDLFADRRAALVAEGRELRSLACLVGARVVAVRCDDVALEFECERGGVRHRLEFRGDGRDALAWRGSGEPPRLAAGESMLDAVVVSESGYLWSDDGDEEDEDE